MDWNPDFYGPLISKIYGLGFAVFALIGLQWTPNAARAGALQGLEMDSLCVQGLLKFGGRMGLSARDRAARTHALGVQGRIGSKRWPFTIKSGRVSTSLLVDPNDLNLSDIRERFDRY